MGGLSERLLGDGERGGPEAHRRFVAHRAGEFGQGGLGTWMQKIGSQVAQRFEHERTLVEPWVRYLEPLQFDNGFTEKQKVEVQSASRPSLGLAGAVAARLQLDCKETLQELLG